MKTIYTMVGMQYRNATAVVASMKPGTELRLIRDPRNRADFNAVEVWYGDHHVAFVKGTEVAALARWMDANNTPEIGGMFAVTADRWPHVEVDTR